MENYERNLITSALPYANGFLHLGHIAGAYLPADIFTRYLRLAGERTLWICGSDEHGVAITIAAEKEKVTPKDIIDKYHNANKEAFEKFGISFDLYSRTSFPEHHETAREFFADFLKKGYLAEKEEEQFYDENAKMFLPDRYVEGECPNCGADGARGDQCDNCGAYYNQTELKNPKSLVSGKTPIVKKTTHWYIKLEEFQKFLEEYIDERSHRWKANVLQQTRSWLKQGLSERAITRDLDWGVRIDGIEGIPKEKAKGKVLYVWFEAVLGYISATRHLMHELNRNEDEWKKWWQDEGTRYIAFIGKDNIVFHTLMFPALLHAKGGYILPDNVPANEFLNLEGQKFSKSRNWSIDLRDFLNDLPEKRNIDALRYTLAMNFPETRDSDFTWRDFQARNNNELAAIFGNFVNRTLQFLHKNFEGKVPALPEKYKSIPLDWRKTKELFDSSENIENIDLKEQFPDLEENDAALFHDLMQWHRAATKQIRSYRFRDALTATMNIARAANKYFNDEEPWKAVKNDPDKAAKSLYVCCQLVRTLALMFAPVTPFSSAKIFQTLGLSSCTGEANAGNNTEDYWNAAVLPLLEEGSDIAKPEILFTKIEDKLVKEQTGKLGSKGENAGNGLVDFDQFMKIKLRTAKIIEAEKVKKSKKLLKLKVDLGNGDVRQVVAGISEHYVPEELIGKVIAFVANLKPAKIMGIESQGMILAASTKDGKLSVLRPESGDIGEGAEIR